MTRQCDCLNFCGDDPALERGDAEPCSARASRLAAETAAAREAHPPVNEARAFMAAIKAAVRAGMAADDVPTRENLVLAHVTTTRNAAGELVAISLQDDEHRMLAVLWQRGAP